MKKYRRSIRVTLFTILNSDNSSSSDFVIAKYLLQHYNHLKEINIKSMSEDCFVDRSTIRRFFKKFGFDSFLSFKRTYSDEFNNQPQRMLFTDYDKYIAYLNTQIHSLINHYSSPRSKTKEIDNVVSLIMEADNVYLFGSDSVYGDMYTIQQHLLSVDKLALIKDPVVSHDIIQEHDCVVVISLSGRYYNAYSDLFDSLTCNKLLITIHEKPEMHNKFTYVAQLTSAKTTYDESIYRNFALPYFIDIMIQSSEIKSKR